MLSLGAYGLFLLRICSGLVLIFSLCVCLSSVAKALQEFDLALRGKKKRKKFMQDTQKKSEMTVSREAGG